MALHVFGKEYTHEVVQWALDMVEAGYHSDHLVELAGQNEPFHWFEMKILMDKVFIELSLDYSDRDAVIQQYAGYLVDRGLQGKSDARAVLALLHQLYLDLDYPDYLHDFYLLYLAHRDSQDNTVQRYWDGATRENIEEIIAKHFIEWRAAHG